MTDPDLLPLEFFDRYRNPGCETEASSVEDVEEVELFTDMIDMALQYAGRSYDELTPRVLVDKETGEIGVALFQVPVLNEEGEICERKLDQAVEKFGYSVLVFISKTGVSCLAPGFARIRFTDDPRAVPMTAAMFVSAIIGGNPVTFPDCSDCFGGEGEE